MKLGGDPSVDPVSISPMPSGVSGSYQRDLPWAAVCGGFFFCSLSAQLTEGDKILKRTRTGHAWRADAPQRCRVVLQLAMREDIAGLFSLVDCYEPVLASRGVHIARPWAIWLVRK